MKVLIAGVGNVLRGDDGFGVAVAQALGSEPLPDEVEVIDVGIGGIHLVQRLFDRADGLVVVDAVDLGRAPGTVMVIRPEVRDVRAMSLEERHDQLADMHYSTPERAFMLARGLEILPPTTWIVGCQPWDAERWGEGLSPAVAAAIRPAIAEVQRIVVEMGVEW
ncbi:hypothetical protein BH24ACT26_BH24ACT26_02590 [soil metagenome]